MRVATKFCAIQSYAKPWDVANFAELEYELWPVNLPPPNVPPPNVTIGFP